MVRAPSGRVSTGGDNQFRMLTGFVSFFFGESNGNVAGAWQCCEVVASTRSKPIAAEPFAQHIAHFDMFQLYIMQCLAESMKFAVWEEKVLLFSVLNNNVRVPPSLAAGNSTAWSADARFSKASAI